MIGLELQLMYRWVLRYRAGLIPVPVEAVFKSPMGNFFTAVNDDSRVVERLGKDLYMTFRLPGDPDEIDFQNIYGRK